MSFVPNGGLDSISNLNFAANNTQETSSFTNPFGLQNFSSILDDKFGNNAFVNNILAKPKGTKENINPFAQDGKSNTDYKDYYNKGNPYTALKPKSVQNANKSGNKVEHSSGFNSSPNSIFTGFNKGSGMVSSDRSQHKLDFSY